MPEWMLSLLGAFTVIALASSLLVLREAYRDRQSMRRLGTNGLAAQLVITGLISQLIRVTTTLGAMAVFGAVLLLEHGTDLRSAILQAGTTLVVVGLAGDGVYDLITRRRLLAKIDG